MKFDVFLMVDSFIHHREYYDRRDDDEDKPEFGDFFETY